MWAHFTKAGSGWTLRRGKALKNESAWRFFLVGLNLGQGMGFVFLDKRVSTELWLTKQFRGKEMRPSAPCMHKSHLFTKTGSGPT